jgi:hypothetical protein
VEIMFTKEKNGAEFKLAGLPADAVVFIEKVNTERDLIVKSPEGQTLAMIRGVDSFASFGFSIEKLAKKTWVDGQQ